MLSDELYDLFRADVVDTASPYLWSDDEVWRYMNDAYRMYVRRTGGISARMDVGITAGEATTTVSPAVLKFREARLVSNGRKIDVINHTDMPYSPTLDYGNIRTLYLNPRPGPVQYMVVGDERNKDGGIVTWLNTPEVDDTVNTLVYRLPLVVIDGPGLEFADIGEEHHEHLMLWMKHRAYGKQDAETFDRGRSDMYKAAFYEYCDISNAEKERYKTKVRVVAYGGL